MNLLPSNATLIDQNFASWMDSKIKMNFEEFSIDPLNCHVSVLEHIALIKGADIKDMDEDEIRTFLNTFVGEKKGTIGAVSKASMIYFTEVVIREWFENTELQVGEFDGRVTVNDDFIYNREVFDKTTKAINDSKNVRSEFVGYEMHLPSKTIEAHLNAGSVLNLELSNDILFNSKSNLNIGGNVVWTV